MNKEELYSTLAGRLEPKLGSKDPETRTAIVGFGAGSPVSMFRFGGSPCPSYVTCELAVSEGQKRRGFGRFELLFHCPDEPWAQGFLTAVAIQTFSFTLGHGHTVDLSQVLEFPGNIAGALFELFDEFRVGLSRVSVVRCVGVTGDELRFAVARSVPALVQRLTAAKAYPITDPTRASTVTRVEAV